MPERTPHKPSSPARPAPRRRLSAEQAQARILAAAERKLAEVGPEGLRLTELAAELGISHPAILHHFGSREELVGAVVAHAMTRFNERLTEAIAGQVEGGREAIFDMIAEFYGGAGNARLIAWLVLSRRTQGLRVKANPARAFDQLIKLAHDRRVKAHPERSIDFEDSRFRSQLTALALLGDAVFGDLVRYASGDTLGPEGARGFRRRLAKLLAETE